ncbi:hypothetical protein JTB14_026388 [Gonioctena quinquepunctata]|nr:hypothetical protein JTB14_026388 [Gonioctena quinquepunctata]
MRIFNSLYIARGNPKEPVPFKAILPLKLKSTVSGKGNKTSEVCCVYEMSIMFSCFKENEFNQSACSKEIETFQKCYTNHLDTKKTKYERETKGVLTPGEKSLTHKQINLLLKKFPNVK